MKPAEERGGRGVGTQQGGGQREHLLQACSCPDEGRLEESGHVGDPSFRSSHGQSLGVPVFQ